MGVNDLNLGGSGPFVADSYYEIYRKLALEHSNVNFYLLSINPVDDTYYANSTRKGRVTNRKIKDANEIMKKYVIKDNLTNLVYCDSYNSINFEIPDGIHYNSKTSQKIINYITNKCVVYK